MRAISCIVLVIGLLKFAQEAPELFKRIFNFGGDLLKGMDLNPRGQLRRQAEPALRVAGRLGSGVAGGLGGAAAGIARGFKNADDDFKANGGDDRTRLGRARRRLHKIGATFGGGARGLVRGGAHGLRNPAEGISPRDMYGQLISGTEQGHESANRASHRYREGNSTHLFNRILTRGGHRLTEFGSEHIIDPARDLADRITNTTTSSEIAEVFNNVKRNNTAAMTATGTDTDIEKFKSDRDETKSKISQAESLAMSKDEMLNHLGMTEASVRSRADELIRDGYTVKGYTPGGDITADSLRGLVDAIYQEKKDKRVAASFDGMSNEGRSNISQINAATIDELQRSASMLSEDSLKTVLEGIYKTNAIKDEAGHTLTMDANVNKALDNLVKEMQRMNRTENLSNGQDAAALMKALDTMQSKLGAANREVTARQAADSITRPARQANNNNNNNDSGNGGSS